MAKSVNNFQKKKKNRPLFLFFIFTYFLPDPHPPFSGSMVGNYFYPWLELPLSIVRTLVRESSVLFAIRHSPFPIRHSSFTTRYSPFWPFRLCPRRSPQTI